MLLDALGRLFQSCARAAVGRALARRRRSLAITVIGVGLLTVSVGPLPALAFDPNAAASYADHHWSECGPSPYNGTPPSPYVCMQNDCTNYASRVLHAGGYSFVLTLGNQWYWYNSSQKTRSWYDASSLYEFLMLDKDANGRGGGTLVSRTVGANPNQLYNSLSKGDLIFMDWTDDNIIDHVRVEAGWGTPPRFGYQPSYNNSYWTTGDWADQHTEVRYHDFWHGYYQLDATTRRTVQIFQVHIDPLNV